METTQAELLPPIGDEELPVLRVSTPLESLKEFFDKMAASQERAIMWAENTVITNPTTRDEARSLRKSLQAFKKAVDDKRLLINRPVEDYLSEFKAMCDEVIARADQGVKILDAKGVAYAEECKREEDRIKAEALAKRRAEEEKIEAARRQRQAEEEKIRFQEAETIRKAKEEAAKQAKKRKDDFTVKAQAEEAAKAELAKIEQARADRERKEKEDRARETAEQDRLRAEQANTLAKATAMAKTKGVRQDWIIEVVDASQIPPQFKIYDPKKALAFCKAGLFGDEKDELKIIPGLRCYTQTVGSGR